jgi:AhpD family alkylhydroperoxidase
VSKSLDYTQIAPGGAKALGGVYGYVMQSGLLAALAELVYLRVSQINNCAYCLDMHTRDLLKKEQKVRHRLLSGRTMDGLRTVTLPSGANRGFAAPNLREASIELFCKHLRGASPSYSAGLEFELTGVAQGVELA